MKKGLLIVGAIAIALATVPMFAAYEAHVINVTAHIENALTTHGGPIALVLSFLRNIQREISQLVSVSLLRTRQG